MSAILKRVGLAGLCAAQLAAAGWSIARYESTLSSGAAYKIRAAPVDPADAFRGRYVAVQPSFTIEKPVAPDTEQLLRAVQSQAGRAYVVLETDAEGFARAGQVVGRPPAQGDYLEIERATTAWNTDPSRRGQAEAIGYNLGFVFDRYYMNEAAAPAASQRYVEATRRGSGSRAWLTVRVKDGIGVIDGLFIDGVPIERVKP